MVKYNQSDYFYQGQKYHPEATTYIHSPAARYRAYRFTETHLSPDCLPLFNRGNCGNRAGNSSCLEDTARRVFPAAPFRCVRLLPPVWHPHLEKTREPPGQIRCHYSPWHIDRHPPFFAVPIHNRPPLFSRFHGETAVVPYVFRGVHPVHHPILQPSGLCRKPETDCLLQGTLCPHRPGG
jgi:hypothetical protein